MERRGDFHDLQAWQEQLGGHAQWAITQHRLNEKHAFHLHWCSHEGASGSTAEKRYSLFPARKPMKSWKWPMDLDFAWHRRAFLAQTWPLLFSSCVLSWWWTLDSCRIHFTNIKGCMFCYFLLINSWKCVITTVHDNWWNDTQHDCRGWPFCVCFWRMLNAFFPVNLNQWDG